MEWSRELKDNLFLSNLKRTFGQIDNLTTTTTPRIGQEECTLHSPGAVLFATWLALSPPPPPSAIGKPRPVNRDRSTAIGQPRSVNPTRDITPAALSSWLEAVKPADGLGGVRPPLELGLPPTAWPLALLCALPLRVPPQLRGRTWLGLGLGLGLG